MQQKRDKQNAPITIQDVVAYTEVADFSYGEAEAHTNKYPEIDMMTRLLDQIKVFSQIANCYHEQSHYSSVMERDRQLNAESINTITRLSLNEFSLYGKRPLTLEEFALLVESTSDLAKRMHENVHLLLSSFSVKDDKGAILNIVLYVQGGEDAKVDIINKSIASSEDITYENSPHFSQHRKDKISANVSTYVASRGLDNSIISNRSILEIKTQGGAQFILAVDICLDHTNEHAKRLFLQQINSENIDTVNLIPEQGEHLVTSNSITLTKDSRICRSVLHIDSRPNTSFDENNKARPINNQIMLTPEHILLINHYPKMGIISKEGTTKVINPPFGSDYRLVVYQERMLEGFVPFIASQVETANERTMRQQLARLLENNFPTKKQHIHAIEVYNLIFWNEAIRLLNSLTEQCTPTFFEHAFKVENYALKQDALSIITDSKITLTELYKEKNSIREEMSFWAIDMKLKFDALDPNRVVSNFITKIKATVNDFEQNLNQALLLSPSPWSVH